MKSDNNKYKNQFEESKNNSDDDAFELEPQEFIFLIDRSGSMYWGKKAIKTAKEALKLFLHSLPVGSLFNVVSFGSNFEFLF